jgi:hypothetical protein
MHLIVSQVVCPSASLHFTRSLRSLQRTEETGTAAVPVPCEARAASLTSEMDAINQMPSAHLPLSQSLGQTRHRMFQFQGAGRFLSTPSDPWLRVIWPISGPSTAVGERVS